MERLAPLSITLTAVEIHSPCCVKGCPQCLTPHLSTKEVWGTFSMAIFHIRAPYSWLLKKTSFQSIIFLRDLVLLPLVDGKQETDALCDVDVKLGGGKWCHVASPLWEQHNKGQLELSAEPLWQAKGPSIRGDRRGRGGPVSATLREITINS